MVQNLRACFIYYIIAIKWAMCVQEEKNEPSSMTQRPRLNFIQIFGISLLGNEGKVTIERCKTSPRGGKKLAFCYLGMVFAVLCHSMALGLVSLVVSLVLMIC